MRRVALFAHYDGQNEVKRYIVHLVAELGRVCDEVVFVSTAKLPPPEVERARTVATRVTLRENRGFDFGMWQSGLSELDLATTDELVLANSSVFGPLAPLRDCFGKMERAPYDFWGMTDTTEIAWHLQSYFLVFRKPVLASGALTRFFAGVLPYASKDQVIRSYEVGLSTWLVEQGHRGGALVPCATLAGDAAVNPTLRYARELVDRGMPFVKVEALRDNPSRIALRPVRARMTELGYDPTLVQFDRPARRSERLLGRLSERLRGRS